MFELLWHLKWSLDSQSTQPNNHYVYHAMTCMLYAVILDITAWEAWCLKCEQTYTVKKSGENWNVIEYVYGVEWKSCIVDTSMIWNFHSTLSANTHWKFNFRRFFLQCQFTLFLSVPALANMHQKTASLTLLIILQELDNYIHTVHTWTWLQLGNTLKLSYFRSLFMNFQ